MSNTKKPNSNINSGYQPNSEKNGYQPKKEIREGYQPTKSISTQPPNQGSSVQPAKTKGNS